MKKIRPGIANLYGNVYMWVGVARMLHSSDVTIVTSSVTSQQWRHEWRHNDAKPAHLYYYRRHRKKMPLHFCACNFAK